jgi:predicted  nucleic acid-binding Zn-ribbon protein
LQVLSAELRESANKSTETVVTLRRELDKAIEDYNLLMDGNTSVLVERNTLRDRATDHESELANVKAAAAADVATLKAKISFAEAHVVDNAAAAEKRLIYFEAELTEDLASWREVYKRNVESIDNLCSPVPEDDPLVGDYLLWLVRCRGCFAA